jgi:hypothetical protein
MKKHEGLTKLLRIHSNDSVKKESNESPSSLKALDDMYQFALSTDGMEPSKRYVFFRSEMSKWDIGMDNRDEAYDLLHSLHPVSKKSSKELVRNDTKDMIASLKNSKDVLGYIQDNYYSLDPDLSEDLEIIYQDIQRKDVAKSLEDGRLGATFEFGKLINKRWEGLDAGRAVRVYARDAVKLFFYNLLGSAFVNSRGDLSFPGPNGETAAHTLPDISDPIDRFVGDNDLMQMAIAMFKTPIERSREEAKKSQKRLTQETHERLMDIPDDIRPNVIIDNAHYSQNPAQSIRDSIETIVSKRIKQGETRSFKDIATLYVIEQQRIEKTLIERTQGYGGRL